MQIHRLRRSLPCRVLLRNGYAGGDSTRRMHRLHGMRGGLPGARHLCGRRRSCGIHKRYRVQYRGVQQDQGLRRRGKPLEMGYCHCENCRRYSAAPVSAFALWKKESVSVIRGTEFLGTFKSSDISDRRYCTKCGSHISVDHPTLGLIDVRIGALRNFPFKPKVHLNYSETILPMKDGLLKLKDFPAEIGGSGETLPE